MTGLTVKTLARLFGVSERFCETLCSGQAIPSLPLAAMIERRTKGLVPLVSWLGTERGKSEMARLYKSSDLKGVVHAKDEIALKEFADTLEVPEFDQVVPTDNKGGEKTKAAKRARANGVPP